MNLLIGFTDFVFSDSEYQGGFSPVQPDYDKRSKSSIFKMD